MKTRERQIEWEREKGVIEKTLLSLPLIHSCFRLILSLSSMRNCFLWGCKLVFVLSVWHHHETIGPFPPPSDCQPSQECINNLLMRASKMHIPAVNVRWRLSAIHCASLPQSAVLMNIHTPPALMACVCQCTLYLYTTTKTVISHCTPHPFTSDINIHIQSQMVNLDRTLLTCRFHCEGLRFWERYLLQTKALTPTATMIMQWN